MSIQYPIIREALKRETSKFTLDSCFDYWGISMLENQRAYDVWIEGEKERVRLYVLIEMTGMLAEVRWYADRKMSGDGGFVTAFSQARN